MEKYTHLDIELRKDYGFRELTVGAKPIGEMLRAEKLGVYAEPSAEWTSVSPSKLTYYEFKYQTRVGLFHNTANEHFLRRYFATNLAYSSSVYRAAFMPTPTPQPSRVISVCSPLASQRETDVLDYLTDRGRHDVAQRLNILIQQIADSPDDNDPIQQESLDSLVKYFVTQEPPYSPYGCVVATSDGILGVEWRLPPTQPTNNQWRNGDGILSLRFLPSGDIVFAGETRPTGTEVEFYDFGEESHDLVANRIAPFFEILRLTDAGQ